MTEFAANADNDPVLVDLQGVFFGLGVYAVAVTIPEEAPHPFSGQRGLMFQFGVQGLPGGHLRVFIPAEAVDEQLGAAMSLVVADLFDRERMNAAAARAQEANLRSGLIPGGPTIYCPGCNSRLFGEIANRGACLGCYPELTT